MTHTLIAALLAAGTVGWFLVALLPALREHFQRTDIGPLRLTGEAANIRYFAHSFHRYVEGELPALRARAAGLGPVITTLSDDSNTWYSPANEGAVTLFDVDAAAGDTSSLAAISESDVRVASGTTVARELYASGSIEGGSGNVYRAVLVGGDASFADETTIVRWADAGGALRVGENSTLWGRVSSSGTMTLEEGTRFQRLAAPRIEFGVAATAPESRSGRAVVVGPPSYAAVGSGRWKMDGDLTIPENGVVDSDIVLTGTLTLGRGASIKGAIRCNALVAANDCVFSRSIVAAEHLTVGERCRITGPVVVEGEAVFGADCRIGEPGDETTISAVRVRVARGVVLCGEVWARRQGIVGSGKETRPDSDLVPATDERAMS